MNRNFNHLEACILAGGLSSRMGRDKSRARLGQRTLTGHIRATIKGLGLKVRLIRRDSVERCGPIGGIATALKSSRADCVLVLACDMPFVSKSFLHKMIRSLRPSRKAVFAFHKRLAGFPLLVRREECLPIVLEQIERGDFSLQALALSLQAAKLKITAGETRDLVNINTPEELEAARNWHRATPELKKTRRL